MWREGGRGMVGLRGDGLGGGGGGGGGSRCSPALSSTSSR